MQRRNLCGVHRIRTIERAHRIVHIGYVKVSIVGFGGAQACGLYLVTDRAGDTLRAGVAFVLSLEGQMNKDSGLPATRLVDAMCQRHVAVGAFILNGRGLPGMIHGLAANAGKPIRIAR